MLLWYTIAKENVPMAKNTNRRIPVKWIRDGAKSAYQKQDHCWICNTTVDLELHHLKSVTLLLEEWAKQNQVDLHTDEQVLAIRDEFIQAHRVELYDEVYTLCNRHHVQLHSVYGKSPPLSSSARQQRWLELQRERHLMGNGYTQTDSYGSFFSKFT